MTEISDLITQGMLERVPADRATAGDWIDAARRHLVSADRIKDVDPEGAYVLLYDAARKAIAAMMLTEGLRARAVPGSHRAVAEYAVRSVNRKQDRAHLQRFDGMRRNRNRVEYGTATIGSQVVESDFEHAVAIVEIAAARIGG